MASKKQTKGKRKIAAGYTRQSVTKDGNVTTIERQKYLIEQEAAKHGWTIEMFTDADKHQSGTTDARPSFQALMARLADPDIVALIVYDMSRLYRKSWMVMRLIEDLKERDIKVIFVATHQQHLNAADDYSMLNLQLIAALDEHEARNVSLKVKDSIRARKDQDKTVGNFPAGTIRNKQGYLIPSPEGIWLMPDGSIQPGDDKHTPPVEGAVWRGYFEATERVLRLYAENRLGQTRIARVMQSEGWMARDRNGKPSPFETDNVRRIIDNWKQFGGLASEGRAKEQHPAHYDLDNVFLSPERAVFPIELLMQVAHTLKDRSGAPKNRGHAESNYPYPLSAITYCAHCEQIAEQANNPKLRSRLGGKSQRRYRHRAGNSCGCTRKSVLKEVYENDFKQLIHTLAIKPEWLDTMVELSLYTDGLQATPEVDLEHQKQHEINKREKEKRQLATIFRIGEMVETEYIQEVERLNREITLWREKTSERGRVAMQLQVCAEAIQRIQEIWETGNDEDRQGMAHYLFEKIVYDLDKQQIVDFRLKVWAEKFLQLRAALYPIESKNPLLEGTNLTPTGHSPIVRYLRVCRLLNSFFYSSSTSKKILNCAQVLIFLAMSKSGSVICMVKVSAI